MATPSWVDAPFTWDTLIIAGQEVPGLAKVRADRRYQLDRKNASGSDGATLTGLGHMPAEVNVTLRIWTSEQLAELEPILTSILPRPHKAKPSAVDVSHPALGILGIRSLYFTEVSAPEETSVKHVFEVKLKATEYLPIRTGENVVNTLRQSTSVTQGVTAAAGTGVQTTGATKPSTNPADTGP